jgi:protein involved in ribonucleotide reduction
MKTLDTKRIIPGRYNRICVADFEVESTTEDLGHVEKTINKLIKAHTDFNNRRIAEQVKRSMGVVGVG